VFWIAPVHPTMGFIQKIFYFHVPCAWTMFLGAIVAAVGGGAYLLAGRRWGDELVVSGTEIATTFGVLVLVTGPLWAKKSWGHYWVWDVRLTTVLVLFLSLLGVLLARRYAGPAAKRVAAGIALFAAVNVPLVYLSVKLWPRTIHPKTTVVGTLPPDMRGAFFVSLAAFSVLFVLLVALRMNLERSRNLLDDVLAAAAQRRER
jgi:heme exporter protein C